MSNEEVYRATHHTSRSRLSEQQHGRPVICTLSDIIQDCCDQRDAIDDLFLLVMGRSVILSGVFKIRV